MPLNLNMFISTLKRQFYGPSFQQEYLCIEKEQESYPLAFYLDGKDITRKHLFLGYQPVVIGIPFENNISIKNDLTIHLVKKEDPINIVAKLHLRLIEKLQIESDPFALYAGIEGQHHLLQPFHQITQGFRMYLRSFRKGNIRLKGNLYKQVQIAYAVPRSIEVISLGVDGYYNFFPTDLFGRLNESTVIISLRSDGKACKQVADYKKIVLSEVNISSFRKVYQLGKNHMKDPVPLGESAYGGISKHYQLPYLPETLSYLELEFQKSMSIGIHQLNFFKITGKEKIQEGKSLSHIHQFTAVWLNKNYFQPTIYLR